MELVFTDEATHDLNHIREFLTGAGVANYPHIIEENDNWRVSFDDISASGGTRTTLGRP